MIPIKGFSRYLGLFCFWNKPKSKIYSLIKYFLKKNVAKLFDFNIKNSENIIGNFFIKNSLLIFC